VKRCGGISFPTFRLVTNRRSHLFSCAARSQGPRGVRPQRPLANLGSAQHLSQLAGGVRNLESTSSTQPLPRVITCPPGVVAGAAGADVCANVRPNNTTRDRASRPPSSAQHDATERCTAWLRARRPKGQCKLMDTGGRSHSRRSSSPPRSCSPNMPRPPRRCHSRTWVASAAWW